MYSTNILVRLLNVIWRSILAQKNPKMCHPIQVTLLKMRPHSSQSGRENATPSSGTSPVASHKEVPPSPPGSEIIIVISKQPFLQLFLFLSLGN